MQQQDNTGRRDTTVPAATEQPTGGAAINETDRLIASDKIAGTPVYNRQGESLGSIYNLMIDKISGQVAYAVMSFGGFLGIGERYHALPWKMLEYDPGRGEYVVELDRAKLEGAPSHATGELPWTDPLYGRTLYGFYGMPYRF